MAKKLAWLYGKRGLLFAATIVAAAVNARCGWQWGFFDGG